MVIVQLIGGLGNQLFQYAFAKRIAEINKMELFLDTSAFYEYYKLHKYSLQHFDITAKIADKESIANAKNYPHNLSRPERIWNYTILGKKLITIQEKEFNFNQNTVKKYNAEHIFINGYWQTEKYFEPIKDILHKEFKITTPQETQDKAVSDQIKNSNAVSLHIRRADYADPDTVKVHGMCSLEYYQNGVKEIASKVENPTFFVFSDDIEWAEQNLKIPYPIVFVGHNNADKNYEDLRLMSECKHNIIANSSFSWWGAWLNSNPKKIVIAPQSWFATTERNYNDVIPNQWTKLKNN